MSAPERNPPARILLVDDDLLLARSLAEYLRRHGFEVLLAHHGREAVRLMTRNRVSLVISDLYMPEADGIELLGWLRRCTPAPLIIAMSGSGGGVVDGVLRMAAALGAARTLEKPFRPAQLLAFVHELIGPAETRAAG